MYHNKCVVIGDCGVGKSSMVITYATNKFPKVIKPKLTPRWDYIKYIMYDNKRICLEIWETWDSDDYNLLRQLSYPMTDVFLICFSVMNKESFKNVKKKWCKEIRLQYKKTPIILVGTKTDLRNSEAEDKDNVTKQQFINYSKGKKMGKKIGAAKYCECSALTQSGLTEIFDEVAKVIALQNPEKTRKKKKNKCSLM